MPEIRYICRFLREIEAYKGEAKQHEAEIEAMQKDPACCPHALRNKAELLEETRRVLPDCERRLAVARQALRDLMVCLCIFSKNTTSASIDDAKRQECIRLLPA